MTGAAVSGVYGYRYGDAYSYYSDRTGQKDSSGVPGIGKGQEDSDGSVRKVAPEECQTCKNRKYKDGSDENVSYKSAAHISPQAAAGAVRAHEGEHVSNAYTSAAQKNGKVVSASVAIHTSVCQECGKTYVSGGTTNTMVSYPANPYEQSRKTLAAEAAKGQNIDYAA